MPKVFVGDCRGPLRGKGRLDVDHLETSTSVLGLAEIRSFRVKG